MIRLSQVSKSFKRTQILNDVTLSIKAGHRVALVGSNGAGKTTLIRCLLGEYTRKGEVEVFGLDPRLNRRDVLRRVGFVPQLPPPLKMPVGDLVRFAAGVCGADPARMEEVAERLGLDVAPIRRRPFVKLSGGQKQKLLIGIALGRDSEILIMDEPAANLDPVSRRVFFSLLAEKRNAVMLISSHRLDEVASLANRVLELDQGRVVLDDCVDDAVDLSSSLACAIRLTRDDDFLAKTLTEWGFESESGGLGWTGMIAGSDRLRFLGMVSRHAAILSELDMKEGKGT